MSRLCPPGDHPREYGENNHPRKRRNESQGSSPRIRGEFIVPDRVRLARGIIPANTGRIHVALCGIPRQGDHPREYGENPRIASTLVEAIGSSPRIRGEWHSATPPQNPAEDHPREYGENELEAVTDATDAGSSPRIRGECNGCTHSRVATGIIPANTGRIVAVHAPRLWPWDHPREYGENNSTQRWSITI